MCYLFSQYRAFPSVWKQIAFSYQVVWARHARSYVVEFFMIVSVRVSCTVFDVPSQSWKGNVRARDSQCRSHLRPLMMGQRQSRTNHGSLCHEARTPHDPFFVLVRVVSAQLKPIQLPLLAVVLKCSCYDAGWMGVTQRWRLSSALCRSHRRHLKNLFLFPIHQITGLLMPHSVSSIRLGVIPDFELFASIGPNAHEMAKHFKSHLANTLESQYCDVIESYSLLCVRLQAD